MAKAKTESRLDKLEATPVEKRRKQSWFDKLPEDQRADLAEFRVRYRDGKYADRTDISLFHFWREDLKFTIDRSAFFHWLKRTDL